MRKLLLELISLSTPRARLSFWALITFVIYILPYKLFENLSLWKNLGWDSAPSVGLTRAYWLLIHNDVTGAWNKNKLIFVVITIGGVILFIDLFKLISSYKNHQSKNRQLYL